MWLSDGQRSQPSSVVDDWVKERSTSTTPAAASGSSSASPTLDLDFINDMALSTSGSNSSLFVPFQTNSYYGSPYNTIPYGSSSWAGNSSLPLSSYSSLNGATTSTTTSSSPPQNHQSSPPIQHQHSPPISSMVIDPALTSAGGSAGPPKQNHQYSHSPPPQSTGPAFPYSQYSTLSSLIPHLYPQAQQRPQQHSAPSQGTLSPQALHTTAPSSLLGAISTSQFYGQPQQLQPHVKQEQQLTLPQHSPPPIPSGSGSHQSLPQQQPAPTPQPQGPTPEQRKQQLYTAIKPLLQSSAFTGAQAVSTLVQRIDEFGVQDVDPTLRHEILTKIRDGAGNHYFRAWGENTTALDITREWLRAAYTAKEGDPLAETTMPLLHIIDRLPLTVESLKNSKLGKLVVKIVKDPPTPAIKDMASNVERRWRQLVEGASKTNGHSSKDAPDPKASVKKRKEPATSSKAAPPAKKPAVGSSTSSKPTASSALTTKASNNAGVKDAKSDTGFFSAPKPKPKLPTFKKAPPTAASSASTSDSVAQPSSIDPFQEVLKSMGKSRTRSQSPASASGGTAGITSVSTTPSTNTPPLVGSSTSNTGLTKSGKKKKSVTWASEEKLESIRFIDKAIYDDDPSDGMHHHSLRDLDRGEGAALHAHLFEETVDWSEPQPIEIPIDIELPPRGEGSTEKITQEEREKTALVAVYLNPAHIPDSPGEPASTISDEDVDKDVTAMTCGPDADGYFFSDTVPQPQETAASTVADLVAQLATGNAPLVVNGLSGGDSGGFGMNGFNSDAGNGFGGMRMNIVNPEDAMAAIQQQMQTLAPEQMQVLLQQLNPAGGSAGYGGDSWQSGGPGQFTDFGFNGESGNGDRTWADTGSGVGGRGGRGGGRFRGRGRGGVDGVWKASELHLYI
ncbi:hypothetical protein VNI00_004740 [Paramarasmius palmivorus]|uniref:TFIIS N-terminal domain-containing protein n=1 Tax=Paramarasmius palmivorus TaxID=297713 RepID=A0AAW0DHT2_9AGAR